MGAFAGARWITLTLDREGWGLKEPLSCSGLALADNDDGDGDIYVVVFNIASKL